MNSNLAFCQDKCQDVLNQGVFETFEFDNAQTFDNQFDSWINSEKFSSFLSSSGDDFGLEIPIPDLPINLGFGSTSERVNEFRDIYNNKVSIDNKKIIRQYLTQKVASKTIIDSWSKCISETKGSAKGLIYEVKNDFNSQYLTIAVRWVPSMTINDATISGKITIVGGSIAGTCLDENTLIGTEWISCIIKKDLLTDNIIIQIPLKDNLGTKTITISGKKEDKKTDLEKCFNGDLNSCKIVAASQAKIVKKAQERYDVEISKCVGLTPREESHCRNKASAKVGQAFSDSALLHHLIAKINQTYTSCHSDINDNSGWCKSQITNLKLEIFRFVNNVPPSSGQIYTFDYKN